jgi:hypothetical protein
MKAHIIRETRRSNRKKGAIKKRHLQKRGASFLTGRESHDYTHSSKYQESREQINNIRSQHQVVVWKESLFSLSLFDFQGNINICRDQINFQEEKNFE